MSVDSRDKRFSLVSLSLPYGRVLPNPDGGFSTTADRAQLEYLYAFGAAPIVFNPAWATSSNAVLGPVVGTA